MSSGVGTEWSRRRRRSVPCGADYIYCTDRYYLRRMKEVLQDAVKPRSQAPADPVQLTEHVYLGNQRNADNCQLLRTIGITHILSCASTRRNTTEDIPYSLTETGVRAFLLIPAEDREDFNIERFFQTTIRFLDNVKQEGGKVLVHCTMGVNRSAAIVAAYLMVYLGWKLLPVISYLKTKRLHVLSNKGFRQQLVNFARQQGYLDPVLRTPDEISSYGITGVSGRDSVGDILADVDSSDVTRRRSASAGRRQRVAVVNYKVDNDLLEPRIQTRCNIEYNNTPGEKSLTTMCNGCWTSSNLEEMDSETTVEEGPATRNNEAHEACTIQRACVRRPGPTGTVASRQPVYSLSNGTCQPTSQTSSTVNNAATPGVTAGVNGTQSHTAVGTHTHCSRYTHYIHLNYQLSRHPHDVTVMSYPRTNTVNTNNHRDGANAGNSGNTSNHRDGAAGAGNSGNTEGFLILVERKTRPLK